MPTDTGRVFPAPIQELIHEFVGIIKAWDVGKYAISISGSMGKGTWDNKSDVDFRFFYEKNLPSTETDPGAWENYNRALNRWKDRGIIVDGIWPRTIESIDAALDRCLNQGVLFTECMWTIWGYQILPDIFHQVIIEDPYGIVTHWKRRLQPYPQSLKLAILGKHLMSLRYWREDYHYKNKVERKDIVFLAGLSSRLVHDVLQVLFALNEVYYVGDGNNLDFAGKFQYLPAGFDRRVKDILYPGNDENNYETQYAAALSLIDDTLALADKIKPPGVVLRWW